MVKQVNMIQWLRKKWAPLGLQDFALGKGYRVSLWKPKLDLYWK